ncbi:hypothetical protein RJ639_019573 [Escallonia herrerae]|uniref:DUF868 domain-containing protein n=1 Tax=Escallonia herrerae TaxID=1293975 RepID=A0AA88V8Y1_9ASTE|nr:hypothetical protein RJ639_019573 [Escallonia herrerae]
MMRNIATCYSEHAIKVSDSYCSGPSNNQAYLSPNLNPSIQNAVVCIYKVKLSSSKQFLITLTWCNLTDQGFTISIIHDQPSPAQLKPKCWQLHKSKGTKRFESCNSRIDIAWDISSAKYDSSPEPVKRFYIAALIDSEISLLLGDMEEDVHLKKLLCNFTAAQFSLISRSEHFSGGAVYSTKAQFCDSGMCHDILVKCMTEARGPRYSALSVWIDKKNVVQVKRLQWNFRGNQTIFLDGLVVDMMWDVHDWFFNPKFGHAVFMFRPRSGLDNRLWLEEKKLEQTEQEKVGFSLLICACKDPD